MTSRSSYSLFLTLAFLLTGSTAFSVVPTKKFPTPTALAARQRSPSTSTVAFLRGDSSASKKPFRYRGHTDTSGEGDPPSHEGIDNKGEYPDTKNSANKSEPKKKGYQRAEDWDAEQRAGGMTWEQKVQYDGLRMGNGVRQNDILQRHLSSF